MSTPFRPGIESLLGAGSNWITGRRLGLVTHAAAVNSKGVSSSQLLADDPRCSLVALFGPEHGLFGTAGAGEPVRPGRHPALNIPIHSLYGKQRAPTQRMLTGIDTIVVDLQDLGVRCYTYVSTLRLVLEAASEYGRGVIVADRPTTFSSTIDGPVTEPSCKSFVSLVPTPLVYGMTPGETARWLKCSLGLAVDLKVARMRGYAGETRPARGWPPWVPPSPAIVSRESALCYPATVSAEAFELLDEGRGTQLPFQVFSASRARGADICARLADARLPGVSFCRMHYTIGAGKRKGKLADGVRITVTNPSRFRPAVTALAILSTFQELCGTDALWKRSRERTDFFDTLWGTPSVRLAIQAGEAPRSIARGWSRELATFRRTRESALLYRRGLTDSSRA